MNENNLELVHEKFARLICEVGLNLQPEQRLFIWANQLELAPLVQQIVKRAYQHGSRMVSVLWNDEQLVKTRFDYAPRDSFDEYPAWKTDARFKSVEQGDAVLWIGGDDPNQLKGYDSGLISKAANAYAIHVKPVLEKTGTNAVQWLVVCPPTKAWAKAVFPDLSAEEAELSLWNAVIKACRLDDEDPERSWKENLDELANRGAYLTAKGFDALRFRAPGTDLLVGLPQGHIWIGGWDMTPGGVRFCANIPTEEVFTLPHRERVDGTVRATRPLSIRGNLIEDFQLTFKQGRVVDYAAGKGEEVLKGLLETGPNASYLGEVALVPHRSPISRQELVFLNTLYDENASDHLALGDAYRVSLEGGSEMSKDEFMAAGGNESLVHVDFMFGSGEMDVDGVMADGSSEPVMRAGEWAFES
jgi:aminopeptidase